MTEYQKTYIELKKQFVATNEGPDSVRALYTFKEELEQSEDQQAKEVLVDMYDLLDFKKDAYELLCQIGNRSDKKTLKRLGTLKDYAENWGNHYALPKPKTPEEKQKEKERQGPPGPPPSRRSGSACSLSGGRIRPAAGRPGGACPPSGITQTLWKLGLLRNPQTALSATAAAKRPTSSIQIRSFPWRILNTCARHVSPAARRPGNMTAAFRTISLWTMA